MTEEEALQALSVGIDLVRECKDKGYQLIGTGEMGIGNTTTSSMLVAALTGRTAEEVTGRGAGLNDAGLLRKQQVIAQALEKYEKEIRSEHALSMLAAFGGPDIAGMAGVCIGGALYHVPVVLDGLISSVAALVAERIVPGVREFVLPSHLSKEPAAKWIAEELKLHPVIDAGLGLGEGTGAVMLFPFWIWHWHSTRIRQHLIRWKLRSTSGMGKQNDHFGFGWKRQRKIGLRRASAGWKNE